MRSARRACPPLGIPTSVVAIALALMACGDPASSGPDAAMGRCTPGMSRSCLCLGGAQGTQVCRETGDSYSPCGGCGDLPDLPTAADLGGSACGDCDGCCDGSTCV